MAKGQPNETLISFVSGHYKKVRGEWAGDSVWCHFNKEDGGMVHINKEKVEYIETFRENTGGGSTVRVNNVIREVGNGS